MKPALLMFTRGVVLSAALFVCLGIGTPVIPAETFLDRARFDQSRITSRVMTSKESCKTVRGAIVNHHALASDLLSRLFQRLAVCRTDVKRIIVLSPDHFFQGRSSVTTGDIIYEIDKKRLQVDTTAVHTLIKQKVALSDPKLFRREHGIGALIPFLAEAFPEAKLVPIVIRSDLSRTEAQRLSGVIRTLLTDETLLIVSSDMSHYLPESIAERKDRETLRAFEKQDQSFFWAAKDDHLDFGKGVWLALQALTPQRFVPLEQSISTKYGSSAAYTTTYLTGMWY